MSSFTNSAYPVGKIVEKAVCRSVFLFWRFYPLGSL